MPHHNIIHLLIKAAETQPDRTALVYENEQVTYQTLLDNVKATAIYFTSLNIAKGDKVLVFVPMSTDLYRIVLALLYIGACPVFIDEWVSLKRLKECIKAVPCKGLVAGSKLLFLAKLINTIKAIPVQLNSKKYTTSSFETAPVAVSADDTALITFTTGSTGKPKAANRTHGYLKAQYDALEPLLKNDAVISLVTLPIVVLVNLGLGKTTLLPPKGFSIKKPDSIKRLSGALASQSAEEIVTSPSVLNSLVRSGMTKAYTANIRYIFTGGGAVFPDDAQSIIGTFSNAQATVVYGSTEAEPISHIDMRKLSKVSAEEVMQYGLPVGMPDQSTQCTVIPISQEPIHHLSAADWQTLQLSHGHAGELVVTGNHVLKSYINNPEAEQRQKIIIDGQIWHRTGDAGYISTEGSLYLLGPCKEIIEANDKTHYPFIVSYLVRCMTNAEQAALLNTASGLLLVIQKGQGYNTAMLKETLIRLQLESANVVYIKRIPTDKRHRTKIDYSTLRRKLKHHL